MKILYVADLSSHIATNWIRYFVRRGDDVAVVSTQRAGENVLPQVRVYHLPLSSSRFCQFSSSCMCAGGRTVSRKKEFASRVLRTVNRTLGVQGLWQSYISPLQVRQKWGAVQEIVDRFQPDLIHALRISTEGFFAARVMGAPLIVSVWGNDFTLHARKSFLSRQLTQLAVTRADGLHADCQRDIALAAEYGYANEHPTLVIPANGGIPLREITPAQLAGWRQRLGLAEQTPVVIHARGARSYVQLESFFNAIPLILAKYPDAVFICPALRGHPLVTHLVKRLGVAKSVRLLPVVSEEDLAMLFQLAAVMVSPTTHDGTPITMLEGMARGTFPVMSNLASIREWIVPEENGILMDPTQSTSIAAATLRALGNPALRARARTRNQQLIRENASYEPCMRRAVAFYQRVMEQAAYPKHHAA